MKDIESGEETGSSGRHVITFEVLAKIEPDVMGSYDYKCFVECC